MNIPSAAVDAAKNAGDAFGLELTSPDLEQLLNAAAPLIAAQAWTEGFMAGRLVEINGWPTNPYTEEGS